MMPRAVVCVCPALTPPHSFIVKEGEDYYAKTTCTGCGFVRREQRLGDESASARMNLKGWSQVRHWIECTVLAAEDMELLVKALRQKEAQVEIAERTTADAIEKFRAEREAHVAKAKEIDCGGSLAMVCALQQNEEGEVLGVRPCLRHRALFAEQQIKVLQGRIERQDKERSDLYMALDGQPDSSMTMAEAAAVRMRELVARRKQVEQLKEEWARASSELINLREIAVDPALADRNRWQAKAAELEQQLRAAEDRVRDLRYAEVPREVPGDLVPRDRFEALFDAAQTITYKATDPQVMLGALARLRGAVEEELIARGEEEAAQEEEG